MPTDTLTPVLKGGPLEWRPTKVMNMRDLSMDDDFLSHLLVEKLGTGDVPLHVHKMDSSRRLPKTDARDLLKIVRRVCRLPSFKSAHILTVTSIAGQEQGLGESRYTAGRR